MKRILVTGSNGQLGMCIQKIAELHPTLEFTFMNIQELDITNMENMNQIFETSNFDYCINCAAYTNVEQAEKTPERAFEVNAEGAKNLALSCLARKVVLIHISTDYVFDGEKEDPYTVDDIPNPINEYGKSKLQGEKYIQAILKSHYIVRTSWLYSEFGKNFYQTILTKAKTENVLFITDEQIGCPTDANNFAKFIFDIIIKKKYKFGVYHFTDELPMTWCDFAKIILKENNLTNYIKAKNYTTFAKRPKNSILN